MWSAFTYHLHDPCLLNSIAGSATQRITERQQGCFVGIVAFRPPGSFSSYTATTRDGTGAGDASLKKRESDVMGDNYILDANGEARPTDDFLAWVKWFEKADRHLGKDTIGDVKVSTVFLGMDHSFGHGPPLLWETMVFGGKYDEEQERYSTKEAAVAGHEKWVALVHAESVISRG
jgi:hypothetical protein